jgi:type I restriction enzyme, S subunit
MADSENTKPFYNSTIPSDWGEKRIGRLTKVVAGGTPSTSKEEYWNGNIPWMNSGELNLKRVQNVANRITEEGLKNSSTRMIPKHCILIGLAGQGKTRGTVAINLIELCTNQSIAAIYPSDTFDEEYLFQNLDSRYDELRQLSTGDGGRGGLNLNIINSVKIPLPPLPEQKAIAHVLGLMDSAINHSNQLIAQKELRKKWLMQNLVTGKKRLKGFDGEWKVTHLGSIAKESIARNNGKLTADSLMAVTKASGIIPMRERVQGVTVSRCKLIEKDSFAYNPMRLNIGSISRWTVPKKAMVSGDYVVFRCNEGSLDPSFLDFFRQTNAWTNFVERAGDGSVRVRIYFSHLKHLKINLPPFAEQTAIAEVLQAADKEITLLKTKTEKLREQKKWLMQQLLTGKKRLKIVQ